MSTDTVNPSSLTSSSKTSSARTKNEGGYQVGGSKAKPTSLVEWFAQNIRQVALVAGSLMLLAGGFSVYQNKREKQASQARDAQYLAMKALREKLTVLEKPATPPAADPKKKGVSAVASTPVLAALKDFGPEREAVLKVAQTYPGTRAAYESYLAVADLELERGDAASAVSHYEWAVREARTPFDRDQAKLSLGYAQEATGKKAEAVVTWSQVSDAALETTLTAEALVSAARVQLTLGKKPEAQKALERALAVAPGSEPAARAERLKASL